MKIESLGHWLYLHLTGAQWLQKCFYNPGFCKLHSLCRQVSAEGPVELVVGKKEVRDISQASGHFHLVWSAQAASFLGEFRNDAF